MNNFDDDDFIKTVLESHVQRWLMLITNYTLKLFNPLFVACCERIPLSISLTHNFFLSLSPTRTWSGRVAPPDASFPWSSKSSRATTTSTTSSSSVTTTPRSRPNSPTSVMESLTRASSPLLPPTTPRSSTSRWKKTTIGTSLSSRLAPTARRTLRARSLPTNLLKFAFSFFFQFV